MAPDKIYLCADAPRMYDWNNAPFEKSGNIEYIRKDALLEYLQKEYEINKWFYDTHATPNDLHTGRCEAYKKVIDKIESL